MKKYKKQLFLTGSLIVILTLGVIIFNNSNNTQAKIESRNTEDKINKKNMKLINNDAEIQSSSDSVEVNSAELDNNPNGNSEVYDTFEERELLGQADINQEEPKEISDDIKAEIDQLIKNYYNSTSKLEKNILQVIEDEDLNKIADEILMKRKGMESYKDINTYVRRGISKDTYVVFTSYNIKFENIETLAPGMSVLYIVTSEDDGKLKIYNIDDDEDLNNHIEELSKDEEIVKVIKMVNTELKSAIEKDETLKTLVENLKWWILYLVNDIV